MATSNVQILVPGRRVRVTPEQPDVVDVLEYAKALIEVYGWLQYKAGEDKASTEENGFTLHDAIGEACTRLSAVTHPQARGSKDWSVSSASGNKNLRTEAMELIKANLPQPTSGAETDKTFNDQATGVDQVLNVLDMAIAEARNG